MDAIHEIVGHVHSYDGDSLADGVVTVTKRFIFDAIAVMMAGRRAAGCAEVERYVRAWSGKPDAIMVTGYRAPAPYAAMVNSMMAHAVEFDDTYEPADVHGYAVVLPTILAAAELGSAGRVSGRELIVATVIGIDIAYRLGSAIKIYRGWQPTSTCGNLAAALAGSRIARNSRDQTHNAAGIAYGMTAGNFQAVVDASLTKRLQPGFSARAAVEAILLAQAGITGARDVLEGKFGFFPLYENGEYDASVLTAGLGRDFLTERASMKPYPCCRFCHPAIDAALAIAKRADFPGASEIASIDVDLPEETYDYVGKPFAIGPNPTVSAQFSVPFTVASALLRGRVGLGEFSSEAIHDGKALKLAKNVVVHGRPGTRYGAVTVRISFRSGLRLEHEVTTMKGEPGNPLTSDELLEKARECVRFGGFSESTLERLSSWADDLEREPDPLRELHAIFRDEDSRVPA